MNNEQREAVVAEAKTWAGTPYQGWACIKGAGVDCGQLIYGVYRNVGLVGEIELPKDYSIQVTQHRASRDYLDIVDRFFEPITEAEALPGDLVVYKLGHGFSHAGIIVEWPGFVIHAEARHGVAGTHGLKAPTFRNRERIFRTFKKA